jgi:ATP-binding cassette subfamily B protein
LNIWGNASKLQYIIRQRLFNHFTNLDGAFYDTYRTGDLMAHATNALNTVRMVAGGGILMVADIFSVGLTTIIAMIIVVDIRLTLAAMIPLLFLAIGIRIIGQRLHTLFRGAQAAFSNMNNKVQESIQGMKVLKSFGQEEEDTQSFREHTQDNVNKNQSVYQLNSLIDPMITIIIGLSNVITIIFGGYLVMINEITIGDFVTFVNYIGMLVWPMLATGQLFNLLERGNASYARIDDLMDEESSIIEKENAVTKPAVGNLSYQVENFAYPPTDEIVLSDIHFELGKGETLGVVGKTGSGKTSLFKLLLREYDNYEGRIIFGGYDIKDYSLDALLNQIGYVPQENFLFSDTIEGNIRFSNPDLPMAAVEKAAKIADIHEDILEFREGYETRVGERGVSLSGGQKQRVAIARALITNPELLILDDSLSAVDAETEEEIIRKLKEVRSDQTTIISAHRISSVMHADEIIVLDEGKITERGTHKELIEEDTWYREMFNQQQLEQEPLGGEA